MSPRDQRSINCFKTYLKKKSWSGWFLWSHTADPLWHQIFSRKLSLCIPLYLHPAADTTILPFSLRHTMYLDNPESLLPSPTLFFPPQLETVQGRCHGPPVHRQGSCPLGHSSHTMAPRGHSSLSAWGASSSFTSPQSNPGLALQGRAAVWTEMPRRSPSIARF